MDKKKEIKKDDVSVLVTFIKQTKDGKYAPIVEDSLQYARMDIETQPTYDAVDYYYSMS